MAEDLAGTPVVEHDPRNWKRQSDLVGPDLLRHAVEEYKPAAVYALFSGGHDSLVATHMAMSTGLVNSVVHIDTGVGLEATADFVHRVAREQQWPLMIIRARALGQNYESIVEELGGFPGPGKHGMMYNRLKDRGLKRLTRDAPKKRGDAVMLVSGGRSKESARRKLNVSALAREEIRLWVNIAHSLSDAECANYIVRHNLPKNPVKALLCMSGECLCGAFARKNELRELVMHYPDDPTVKKLVAMSQSEIAAGRWAWDSNPREHWQCRSDEVSGGQLCTSCLQGVLDLFDEEKGDA